MEQFAFCLLIFFLWVDVPAKIHVAFDRTTWDNQIRISLRIDRRDVVVAVV
jgi:hypothetical protein